MSQLFFNTKKINLAFSPINQYIAGSFHGNFIFSHVAIKLLVKSIIHVLLKIIDINKPVLFLGASKFYPIIKNLSYLWNSPYLLLERKINLFSFEQSMWAIFLRRKMPIYLRLYLFNTCYNTKTRSLFFFCKKYKSLRVLLPFFRRSKSKFNLRYTIKFNPIYNYNFKTSPLKAQSSLIKKFSFIYLLYKYRYFFNNLNYNKFIKLNKMSNLNLNFFNHVNSLFLYFTQLTNYNPIAFVFSEKYNKNSLNFFYSRNFLLFTFSASTLYHTYNIPFYSYSTSNAKQIFYLFLNLRKQLVNQNFKSKINSFSLYNTPRLSLLQQYSTNLLSRNLDNKTSKIKIKSHLLLVYNSWGSSNNLFWNKYYSLNKLDNKKFIILHNVLNSIIDITPRYEVFSTTKKITDNFLQNYILPRKNLNTIKYIGIQKQILQNNKLPWFYFKQSANVFSMQSKIKSTFILWSVIKKLKYIYFHFLNTKINLHNLIDKSLKKDLLISKYQVILKQLKMNLYLFSKFDNNWFYYYYTSNINLKLINNKLKDLFSTSYQISYNTINMEFREVVRTNFLWAKYNKNPEILMLYSQGFNLKENNRYQYTSLRNINWQLHHFFYGAFKRNYFSFYFISGFYLRWIKNRWFDSFRLFGGLKQHLFFKYLRFSWRNQIKGFKHFSNFKQYLWRNLNQKWNPLLLK